jgi:hypothetical protein
MRGGFEDVINASGYSYADLVNGSENDEDKPPPWFELTTEEKHLEFR